MAIPGYKDAKTVYFPKSDRIVHHKQHAYDDHGKVIVVDIEDEDRQELINSYKDTVGLKNILRSLQLIGSPIPQSMMYSEADAIDMPDMPDNIADLKKAADAGDQVIRDAVNEFNSKMKTNYSAEEFIKMMADGSLMTKVQADIKEKEKSHEEEGDK